MSKAFIDAAFTVEANLEAFFSTIVDHSRGTSSLYTGRNNLHTCQPGGLKILDIPFS